MPRPNGHLEISDLADSRLSARDRGKLEAALAGVDQAAVFAEAKAAVEVVVWDKVSPINDLPADYWLSRTDVDPDSEIYLVLHDGAVVYFQPHAPVVPGNVRMKDANEAREWGRKHALDGLGPEDLEPHGVPGTFPPVAHEIAQRRVVEQVERSLRGAG